jgi:hypothetical protein
MQCASSPGAHDKIIARINVRWALVNEANAGIAAYFIEITIAELEETSQELERFPLDLNRHTRACPAYPAYQVAVPSTSGWPGQAYTRAGRGPDLVARP